MRILILYLLSALLPASLFAQNDEFELYGNVKGDYKGKIYLFYDDHYKHKDSIWSLVEDGRFYFHEKAGTPVLGRLFLEGDHSTIVDLYLGKGVQHVTCVINKAPIPSTGDTMQILSITSITGSPLEDKKRDFYSFLDQLNNSGKTKEEKTNSYYERLLALIKDDPGSKLGASILSDGVSYFLGDHNVDNSNERLSWQQVQTLYNLFDPSLQGTYEMKKVKALLAQLKVEHRLDKGVAFCDVLLKDTSGKVVNTKQIRGKYTLIDFWASWCGPCVAQMPAWNALYDKYRNDGLEMLGVSLDTDKAKWKKAIRDKAIKWRQLSDLQGKEGELEKYYDITGIPFNLLLDKDGRLIAADLSPQALEKWLSENLVAR